MKTKFQRINKACVELYGMKLQKDNSKNIQEIKNIQWIENFVKPVPYHAIPHSERISIDPRNVEEIGEFVTMKEEVKRKYANTWIDFCDVSEITATRQPTEEDFLEYFKMKRDTDALSDASLIATYSHLNKACYNLYGWKLQKWPEIYGYIKSTFKNPTRVYKKKYKVPIQKSRQLRTDLENENEPTMNYSESKHDINDDFIEHSGDNKNATTLLIPKKEILDENPWAIESIYQLQFFNCPSCGYRYVWFYEYYMLT